MRYSLLLCLLLLLGCDKKETFQTLADKEQNELRLQILASAKTIDIADQLTLKMVATFPADQTVKSMDFVTGSYDVMIDDLVRSNAKLISSDTLEQSIFCKLYANKFGVIELPDFKVELKNGDAITADALTFSVKESELVEAPHGIEKSFIVEENHHWYVTIFLVVGFGVVFTVFRNGKHTKGQSVDPLSEILKSDKPHTEIVTDVYNFLKKNSQNPEVAMKLEKAIFDKNTHVDTKQILKKLEEQL